MLAIIERSTLSTKDDKITVEICIYSSTLIFYGFGYLLVYK